MNKLFFLIVFCTANYAFSQNQLLIQDKKTTADAGKSTALINASDSLSNTSANCTLDMRKTTDAGKGTTGNEVIKNDNPAPKELFLKNTAIITSPLKDEK